MEEINESSIEKDRKDEIIPVIRNGQLTQKYWKLIRFILYTLCLWPGEAIGETTTKPMKYYRIYTLIQHPLLVYGQIHYITSNFKQITFFELGHILITLFITTIAVITLKVEKYSRIFAYYLTFLSFLGFTVFNLMPIFYNIKKGAFTGYKENITLETSVYLKVPFDYSRNIYYWVFITIYNYYICWQGCLAICIADLYFFMIAFQVMGHISIIEHNFIHMKMPANRMRFSRGEVSGEIEVYSEEENRHNRLLLIRFLEHHELIINFVKDISDCFGNVLLSNYVFHMLSGCIILLELIQGSEAYVCYGPLALLVFGQLIIFSLILENVGTMSDKLGDAVYSSPWHYMNISNQKMVKLILMRAQPALTFKAKGVADVGVKPMLGIIKSTLSYFAFLQQKNE